MHRVPGHRLAVVIVNYRSADHLGDCLGTLPAADVIERVVVVNNSPCDRQDSERLEGHAARDSRVEIIDSAGNVGFGAAANAGIRAAAARGASVVWLLNPDVKVAPGAAEALLGALVAHRPAIVSPLITSDFRGQTLVAFAGGTVDLGSGRVEHEGYRASLAEAPTSERPATFITGAAMMVEVGTFLDLGGFREDLFLYWEDADLSVRALANGVELVVVPAARVWHMQGGSAESRSDLFYYYNQRNRLIVGWVSGGRSPLGLVFGRGLPETLRLIARPVLRDRGHKLGKVSRSVRGVAAGILAVRRLRRLPAGQPVRAQSS